MITQDKNPYSSRDFLDITIKLYLIKIPIPLIIRHQLHLTKNWMKLSIGEEFILKPALLSILHNTHSGFPFNPKLLYIKVRRKEFFTFTLFIAYLYAFKGFLFLRHFYIKLFSLYSTFKNMKQVKELQRNHPNAFSIWRKSEMNIILPSPTAQTSATSQVASNGSKGSSSPVTGETYSSQWSIDIIYFMIRTSNMVPSPKNGWQRPSPPGTNEDGRGYWAWQTRFV